MDSDKPFNYHSGWAMAALKLYYMYFGADMLLTPKMKAVKTRKVDNIYIYI